MTRFNVSVIFAACIVAVSLITSALILTHRPAAATSSLPTLALAAKPMGTPPIAQASVEEQFRTQVLAAPTLHNFLYNGKRYALTDIKVNQVIYTAKDDDFTLPYDCVWQPVMPPGGPQGGYCNLNNDGYGHYYGTAVTVNPSGNDAPSGDVTVK